MKNIIYIENIVNIKDKINNIIPKKDQDIIFRFQLSWSLVPLLFIIWYLLPYTHNIFSNLIICIVVIGCIDIIFYTPITFITKFLGILFHIILLIPFINIESKFNIINKNNKNNKDNKKIKKSCIKKENIKKNKHVRFSNKNYTYYVNDFKYLIRFNIYNLMILLLSIFTIWFLPYWPYYISRLQMILLLIIITCTLWIYSYLF